MASRENYPDKSWIERMTVRDFKMQVWNELRQNGVTLTAAMREMMTLEELVEVKRATHRAAQTQVTTKNEKIRDKNW